MKSYVESLESHKVCLEVVGNHMWRVWKASSPPTPRHKIANFDILPYISFIIAFTASESTKRYWETKCKEFK